MSDKKFTDEEIIKAIKNLFKNTDEIYEVTIQNSKKGVCGEEQHYCIPEGVYDLIMRQSSFIDRQKSEIERLKCSIIVNNIVEGQRIKREAKAEAYKEFAKKLKEKLADCYIVSDGEYCGFDCGDIQECIDNFLKEMLEEKK